MNLLKTLRLSRKGKFLAALALAAVIAVPVSVFAATSDTTAAKSIRGFFGIDATKLTDQQKETVKDYSRKLADLQKEFIDSMVANGAMTKDQGDNAKKSIDENLKSNEINGIIPGFGGGRKGPEGYGKQGMAGICGIDASKLTDAQKKDLTDSCKTIAGLQKEFVGKMVTAGAITKEKGDAILQKIDDLIAALNKNGITDVQGGPMFGFYGFKAFGPAGMDASKLTDEQKSIITDYSAKLTQARKDMIHKLVSDGALTKEQGDAAIQRIDGMQKSGTDNGFPMNGMKKGGRFGIHGKGGSSTSGSAIRSSGSLSSVSKL